MKKKLIFVLFTLFFLKLSAQEYHFGIRGGLNFGKINGTPEGGNLDEYTFKNGFHFGIEALYSFDDIISLGTEISYNQIGSKYQYKGPSYYIFSDKHVIYNDNVDISLSINNSYISIPLNIFIKPIDQLEFKFGGYMGILINSGANGKMKFGTKFNQILKYNYYSDNNEQTYRTTPSDRLYISTISEEGDTIIRSTYKTVTAYSQYQGDDAKAGDLFEVFDFGLNAGINYYVNSSLFFGVNLQYGLKDVTNNKMDRSLSKLGGNGDATFREEDDDHFIFRDDKDKNLNLQFSIGFRF